VKKVTCLGQEVNEKPRTEESRLFDPAIVTPVQKDRQWLTNPRHWAFDVVASTTETAKVIV
jgi:hypothetical protein